jgi:diaminopimelate epimerase
MKSSTPTRTFQINSVIPFSKYTGCGNDFILIDNRNEIFPWEDLDLISHLCDRQFGVGSDGLILLETSSLADFRMRIFNPDNSEAEMCGNGIRCLGKFLQELRIEGSSFTIEVMGKLYPLVLHSDNTVSVTMLPPSDIDWDTAIDVEGETLFIDYLNTGVPHATLAVSNLTEFDLELLGPKIRYHTQFEPQGTNFDIYQIDPDKPSQILIRTYERGVERETMACGTGATACALVAWKKHHAPNPITIQVASGDSIEFEITGTHKQIDQIIMKGPAEFVFRGSFSS